MIHKRYTLTKKCHPYLAVKKSLIFVTNIRVVIIRQICKGRNVAPWRLSNVSFFLVFFQFFGKILVSFFVISFIYLFSVFQRFFCFLCFNDLTVFIVFQDFSQIKRFEFSTSLFHCPCKLLLTPLYGVDKWICFFISMIQICEEIS